MMLSPDTLDRIVEREPYAEARARYAELATEDRPGSPYQVPFDARPRPSRIRLAVIAVEFIAVAAPTIALWVLFG
jgi:hypothetical protein